ncbi:MAG: flavodoxin family protein [Firmicutes bacterium]|nr:flavodoxin family protein [Bacillota bacterium]
MKKVLAILGSPKTNGNAAKMLDIAIDQAEKQNYEVTRVNLYEKSIAYCTGCMKCRVDGVCVIKDDLQEIRRQLIECDLVIISSPTYFANVPAVVKNLFDRLAGAVYDDNHGMIPKPKLSSAQRYILMTTCNTPAPFDRLAGQSAGSIRAMKEFFHISGMKCKGIVVFAGTRKAKEIPAGIVRKITKLVSFS